MTTGPRLQFPASGMGEHVDWMLLRPDMAVGMGALSDAVYGNTTLSLREREAARWTIAQINDCAVCQGTEAKGGAEVGIDTSFYDEVVALGSSLSARERLAADFARRFCLDHPGGLDDAFWAELHAAFDDGELADLTICCGTFLGMGRAMAVVGVRAPDEPLEL